MGQDQQVLRPQEVRLLGREAGQQVLRLQEQEVQVHAGTAAYAYNKLIIQ